MQLRLRLRFGFADLRLACDVKVAITAGDANSGPYDAAAHSAVPIGVEPPFTDDPEILGVRDPEAGAASSYRMSSQA